MVFSVSLLLAVASVAQGQILAPFDSDSECSEVNSSAAAAAFTLLDTHHYLSLDALWFADDEALDPFDFPPPEDPVRWELVDQSSCRNVWQYCGTAQSDILITQLILGERNGTNVDAVISVEYAFLNGAERTSLASSPCSDANRNVLVLEVDDTTGLDNVHTEVIPRCNGNQTVFRHDFTYSPMNQRFEMVFRSNLTNNNCVNITRVRAFHCNSGSVAIRDPTSQAITCTRCPERHYFDRQVAQCRPCPANSDSTASNASFCVCDEGHGRLNPDNHTQACDQCLDGYVMTQLGSCVSCPLPGCDDFGSQEDACRCYNGTVSSNFTCQFCAANYIRSSPLDNCVLCPAGSRRQVVFDASGLPRLDMEDSCMCVEESRTGSGLNTTSEGVCDDCVEEFLFWNGSQCSCVACPANSQRSDSDITFCECEANSVTRSGSNVTTTEDCMCLSGLYRASDSSDCQICPGNSFRASSDPDGICNCLEGTRRSNETSRLPCLPYVGFNVSYLQLEEGEGPQSSIITVTLSQNVSSTVRGEAALVPTGMEVTLIPGTFTFLAGMTSVDLRLAYMGNAIALEDDINLGVSLSVFGSGQDFLLGGPNLNTSLAITIRDDDRLFIGFTDNRTFYESSETSGSVYLNLSTSIGRDVIILIRTNATLSSDFNPVRPYQLTFSPSDSTSRPFNFDILFGRDDTSQFVSLTLEAATSLNESVRSRITVGQFKGLYQEFVLVLEPSSGLSESAIIGISSSMAVVFAIAVAAVVLLSVTFCRQESTHSKLQGSPQTAHATNKQAISKEEEVEMDEVLEAKREAMQTEI